jgi:TP901 family phage tail tape measure protein
MANNEIKISVVFAKAGASKNVKEFTGTLQEMEQTTKKTGAAAGKSFEKTNKSALKSFGKAGLIGLAATASGAVVLGYNRMIDKGSEFQQQQADLSAITGIAGKDLERLGARSLQTSVKYGESASNIIEANKLVASQLAEKIDFGTNEGLEQLQDISEQAIILQKAAGIDLSTAVNTLTTAVNQFNLPASETNRLINSIAAGSKFGAAEVAEQSAAYAEAGSVAASTNQSFEVLNATTQVLAANAIKGSKAGVSIRNVLLTLNNSAKLAENGVQGVDLQADGLAVTLGKLKPLLEDSAALEKLFGRESITAAQILIKNADSVATMTEKVTGGNVAMEQAEIQLNTYNGAQARLAAAIDAQLIPAFQEVDGIGVRTIDTITNLVQTVGQAIGQINEYVTEADRLNNILEVTDNRTSINENIKRPYEEAKKILAELIQETSKYDLELRTAGKSASEFANQLKGLEEGSSIYKSFTDKIKENGDFIRDTETKLRAYVSQTEYSIKLAQENGDATGLLKEQLREYQERLSIAQEELQKLNDATTENTEDLGENDVAIEALTKQYKFISEAIKEKKEALEKLLNPTKEITKENWEAAKSLSAEIKAYEELNKRRKEYLESIANGDPRPDIKIEDPVDQIIEPDFEPLPSFDIDTNPILEASQAIKDLNQDVLNYITTSSLLGDHTNDINFAMQRTEQTISSLIENGYSPTGSVIQQLVNDYDQLKQAQQAQSAFMQAAANDQISSLRDLGNEVRAQVLSAIKARIAEAVSTQIAKALASAPFPFNVAIAAAAGAAIPLLFNQIPKFEKGGKIGGKKHRDGGTLIEAERDEFITNRYSSNAAPKTLEYLNSTAENARKVERFVTHNIIKSSASNYYEKGGKIGGKRHSDGGTLIEAEKDEVITNRDSSNAAPRTLNAINSSVVNAKKIERFVSSHILNESSTVKFEKGGKVGSGISIQDRVKLYNNSSKEPMNVLVDVPTVRVSESKQDNSELISAIKEQTERLSKVDRSVKILRSEMFDSVEEERITRSLNKTVFD